MAPRNYDWGTPGVPRTIISMYIYIYTYNYIILFYIHACMNIYIYYTHTLSMDICIYTVYDIVYSIYICVCPTFSTTSTSANFADSLRLKEPAPAAFRTALIEGFRKEVHSFNPEVHQGVLGHVF